MPSINKLQRQLFVETIHRNREMLFEPKLSSEVKRQRWELLREEITRAGLSQYEGKSADDLRILFMDMKRRTLERVRDIGGGLRQRGSLSGLSTVDNLVLDIVEMSRKPIHLPKMAARRLTMPTLTKKPALGVKPPSAALKRVIKTQGQKGYQEINQSNHSLSSSLMNDGEQMVAENGELVDVERDYYSPTLADSTVHIGGNYEGGANSSSIKVEDGQGSNFYGVGGDQSMAFDNVDGFEDDYVGGTDESPLETKLKIAKIAYLEAQTELAIAQTNESRSKEIESRSRESESRANERLANMRIKLLELEYQEKTGKSGPSSSVTNHRVL